MEFDEGVLALV